MGRLQRSHRRNDGLDHRAPERLRPDRSRFRTAIARGSKAKKGADFASDDNVHRALILLLAACEQAIHELDQADMAVNGLGAELETLSGRLRDVLEVERPVA